MCCGIFGQGVQQALSLDLDPCGGDKLHFVVVRLILKRGRTNVEIEIREFEGGVRATGLLCLLGVGVGLCTFLAYKLCSQLHLRYFASSSVDKTPFQLSCGSTINAKVIDAGISLGIKNLKKPGIFHRTQLYQPQQFPHVWRKRIIDWLARSTFSQGDDLSSDDNGELVLEDDGVANKLRKTKKLDLMMGSMQSGWSSGFVSNPDNVELGCNNNSSLLEDSKEWQSFAFEDELMDGIEEESEGLGVLNSNCSQTYKNLNNGTHLYHSWNGYKGRRPNSCCSMSSTSSDIQMGQQSIRRNCYSFASHESGESSLYDYRESLISKGFSIDLGENLAAVMLPDTNDFASCDHLSMGVQDHGAVNHMDRLQYELTKIQLDIDCLSQRFDDLCQPKTDELKEQQILENFKTDENKNACSGSASVESREQVTPDVETFDFIWDYHSDLAAVEQPSFISSRPGGELGNDAYESHETFGVSQDNFSEEMNGFVNNLSNDQKDETDEYLGKGVLRTRRESIVLFYFDDDINVNIIGDHERSHSISNIPINSHFSYNNLVLSGQSKTFNKNSNSKQLTRSTNLLPFPQESDTVTRLLQPISPRHLKRSRTEQSNIENNRVCCIERIFSCEDRRIIGDEKKLFEHLESDLNVDVMQISNIRKGYSRIFEMWGSSNVRSFRSERYSILGPIAFQVLLQGIPIISDVGGNFQNSVQHLVAAIDNGHQYLMEWRYKGFVCAPKNEALFKLINSLRIFCEQVITTRGMLKKKCREQYLASLLNHSSDMEIHLVEALKVVIMLKVISFSKVTPHQKHPSLEKLYGPKYSSAELVFKNFINTIEDWTVFDDIQMSLLGFTLGVNIEVISPCNWGMEGFVRSYPTMLAMQDTRRWDKMSIIEDDPTFLYCVPALSGDE